MDAGEPPPGTLNRHYEAVTGGPNGRAVKYLARRHFGLSPQEWGRLPWWETNLLLQGLIDDGTIGGEKSNGESAPQAQDQPAVDLTSAGPVPSNFQTRRVG